MFATISTKEKNGHLAYPKTDDNEENLFPVYFSEMIFREPFKSKFVGKLQRSIAKLEFFVSLTETLIKITILFKLAERSFHNSTNSIEKSCKPVLRTNEVLSAVCIN